MKSNPSNNAQYRFLQMIFLWSWIFRKVPSSVCFADMCLRGNSNAVTNANCFCWKSELLDQMNLDVFNISHLPISATCFKRVVISSASIKASTDHPKFIPRQSWGNHNSSVRSHQSAYMRARHTWHRIWSHIPDFTPNRSKDDYMAGAILPDVLIRKGDLSRGVGLLVHRHRILKGFDRMRNRR